jgi:rod shape-determining protein MreD
VPRPTLADLVALLVLVLAALGAATLGSRLASVTPDLVLPVVVAGALLRGPTGGALLGLAGGWVVDLVPPGAPVLGTDALVYAAVGLLAGAGRREGQTSVAWVALVGLAASAAAEAARLVLALLSGAGVDWPELVLRTALTALLCATAVPVLVRLSHVLRRMA